MISALHLYLRHISPVVSGRQILLPLRRGSLEALPHDGGYLPFIILVGQRDRPGNIGIADLIVCSGHILLVHGQGASRIGRFHRAHPAQAIVGIAGGDTVYVCNGGRVILLEVYAALLCI